MIILSMLPIVGNRNTGHNAHIQTSFITIPVGNGHFKLCPVIPVFFFFFGLHISDAIVNSIA